VRPATAPVTVAVAVLALLGACSSSPGVAADASPTTTAPASPSATPEPTAATPGPEGDGVPVEPDPTAGGDPATGGDAGAGGGEAADDVVPQVTYAGPGDAGAWEVSGVVPGVVEDGGTCRFTLSRTGSAPVEATTTGTADASSTSCGTAVLAAGSLASGAWRVELAYAGGVSGSSSPATLEVP
jgi:hypothetical protein